MPSCQSTLQQLAASVITGHHHVFSITQHWPSGWSGTGTGWLRYESDPDGGPASVGGFTTFSFDPLGRGSALVRLWPEQETISLNYIDTDELLGTHFPIASCFGGVSSFVTLGHEEAWWPEGWDETLPATTTLHVTQIAVSKAALESLEKFSDILGSSALAPLR